MGMCQRTGYNAWEPQGLCPTVVSSPCWGLVVPVKVCVGVSPTRHQPEFGQGKMFNTSHWAAAGLLCNQATAVLVCVCVCFPAKPMLILPCAHVLSCCKTLGGHSHIMVLLPSVLDCFMSGSAYRGPGSERSFVLSVCVRGIYTSNQ